MNPASLATHLGLLTLRVSENHFTNMAPISLAPPLLFGQQESLENEKPLLHDVLCAWVPAPPAGRAAAEHLPASAARRSASRCSKVQSSIGDEREMDALQGTKERSGSVLRPLIGSPEAVDLPPARPQGCKTDFGVASFIPSNAAASGFWNASFTARVEALTPLQWLRSYMATRCQLWNGPTHERMMPT